MTQLSRAIEEKLKACENLHTADIAPVSVGMFREMARHLLRAESQGPVGEDELNAALRLHGLKVTAHSQLSDAFRAGFKYARRTAPQPVAVLDERYQHLSELYHAQEKRLFKIAQRIKGQSFDKYAYSPSQAIDVLEEAIFGMTIEDGSAVRAATPQEQ